MQKDIYDYIFDSSDVDIRVLTRFSWYIEEELDELQKYIGIEHTILHLKVRQFDGSYLYLLPHKLVQVYSHGRVVEIFDTQKHSKDQIKKVLRCFKNLAIQPLYDYVLEINS